MPELDEFHGISCAGYDWVTQFLRFHLRQVDPTLRHRHQKHQIGYAKERDEDRVWHVTDREVVECDGAVCELVEGADGYQVSVSL